MSDLTLGFGRNTTLPDDCAAVWGARLIWPADLLYDRQDLKHTDADAKQALIAWLNGEPAGTGAIACMQDELARLRNEHEWSDADTDERVLYEDEHGRIVGSPQGSYGYVYVAGWLK